MPHGSFPTKEEHTIIIYQHKREIPFEKIAERISRHKSIVFRELSSKNTRYLRIRRPTNQKLSTKDVWHIFQLALRGNKIAKDIRD